MTQQKKRHSLLETVLNVLIGFGVSFLGNALILPHYGIPFNWSVMGIIGVWFTILSVLRGYFVRRLFVNLHRKGILK